MAIRIVRNEAGNCINFHGSSNPTYWNACLSGEVDTANPNAVNVVNDVITAQTGVKEYEFFRMPYTEFVDKDGNGFADAQTAADYITTNANVIGLSGQGIDLIGQNVCFKLDDTSTSIMLDNGYSFGVNTIKATADSGTIKIISNDSQGSITHFFNLEVGNACINEAVVGGGLNDVVNALNELFTVGAFQQVVIADPFSTAVADVDGVDTTMNILGTNGFNPIGDDVFANSVSGNLNGYKSTETIDQAGEYFTFDIRNESQIGFGLIHTQASYDDGYWSGNSNYADPTSFGTVNSAHYGFQFSHWFHPTPNGSWTNYGANTSYVMGYQAWSQGNWDQRQDWLDGNPVKIKVGIDENGYIAIYSLQDDSTWILHARTSYAVPDGAEFHLGIKIGDTKGRVYTLPKVHLLEEAAPTMYFRYIESPDGVFQYPLFATEAEAVYYDEQNGGTGTFHTHVYADDPTNTTWYMADANAVHNGTSAPAADGTLGQMATYTEITSLTNADQIPPAFSSGGVSTLFINELESVNYQTQPQDTTYTTTFSGLPIGLIGIAGAINGTAPEVTGDNVTNPSDTYTVTVTRTNFYGSSTGTLSIIVANLTAPTVTPITGVTDEGGTALIDSDTMADGSVISIDNILNVGNRFTFDKEWVDNYVLPKITAGTGGKSVFIGIPNDNANWSSIGVNDFLVGYQFYSDDTTRSQNNWKLRTISGGAIINNISIGGQTSGLYDYAIINDGADLNYGSLVESQGHNISTYVYNFSGVDSTWKYTGGLTGVTSKNRDVVIATLGTDMDLDLQYFNEYTEPSAPTNQTNWTKALDFSGSNEHAIQVSNASAINAIRMQSISASASNNSDVSKTSIDTYSRPWMCSTVFQVDRHSSNQHIWNSGEGANSGDDNIYLRLSASGRLYFGWGRGSANNECEIYDISYSETSKYFGVAIVHKGGRFTSGSATATNLHNAFDIYLMTETDFANGTAQKMTQSDWVSTGVQTNRLVGGTFTIGGRGSNRSFHGKVASMVVSTLRRNVEAPDETEIVKFISDPKCWVQDYRVGKTVRSSSNASEGTYNPNSATLGWYGLQMWLMGDGGSDSYANGIRNEIYPTDQNYTKLQLNSMVSNDIQTININGLT